MGFWNALSVLAPVAPALSDARDIRTQSEQDAAKLAQDSELKKAQLTAQQMAAQLDQQRLIKDSTVRDLGWNPTALSDQVLIQDPKTGAFRAQNTPGGVDPSVRFKKTIDEYEKTVGRKVTPEENQRFLMQTYGMPGSTSAGMGISKTAVLKGPNGEPVGASFRDGVYRDADGQVISNPVLWEKPAAAVKPPSPAVQFTNLYAKQILANQKKGPPLTPEEAASLQAAGKELTLNGISTATARAVENARYGITNVTDDSGQDVAQTRLNVVNAANAGTPYAAGVVGAPTGMDKKNQMLALSAISQVNRMQQILKDDPKLTGPGNGQLTRLQMWLGTQDPDAQQFLISSLMGSEHGVAVFGGRNVHTIQDLNNALGDMKTNPAALSAALDVVKETMAPWATAQGRLPGPRTAGATPSPAETKQHSIRTAMALPFNKGKTAAQVKADLEAHGYQVVP